MIGNVEDTVRDKIKDITTAINEHLSQVKHFDVLYHLVHAPYSLFSHCFSTL